MFYSTRLNVKYYERIAACYFRAKLPYKSAQRHSIAGHVAPIPR